MSERKQSQNHEKGINNYQDAIGEAHEDSGDEGVGGELGGADVPDECLADHSDSERGEPRRDRRPRHHP